MSCVWPAVRRVDTDSASRTAGNMWLGPRFWIVLLLAGLVIGGTGCEPTGPEPIKFTVPTAVWHTATPVMPLPASPVSPPTPTAVSEPISTSAEPVLVDGVTPTGWSILRFVPGGRVLTPTSSRGAVLWVAPVGSGLGLQLYNLGSGQSELLATPQVPGGCICRGYRRGDWAVMVEVKPGEVWWEVSALDLVSHERIPVGRSDDPAVRQALRPGEFAINSEGLAVWKDVTTATDGTVVEALGLRDLVTGAGSTVVRVRSPVRIGRVEMSDNWVVWNQATEGDAGTRGDVFAYGIASRTVMPIGETGRAWTPAIWGTTVVWKHADGPFADGDVFAFDLDTGEGRLLTDNHQVSEVDVGAGFVVWSSLAAGVIVRRDLNTGVEEILGRGAVGQLTAEDNTIVWLADDEPGTLHIAWKP